MMKKKFFLVCFIFLTGCSTTHTILNAKEGVIIEGSHCDYINHVMSGVAYNWCKIDDVPIDTENDKTERSLERIATDTVFSFVTDVIVLPYTIYKQFTAEPIKVHNTEQIKVHTKKL